MIALGIIRSSSSLRNIPSSHGGKNILVIRGHSDPPSTLKQFAVATSWHVFRTSQPISMKPPTLVRLTSTLLRHGRIFLRLQSILRKILFRHFLYLRRPLGLGKAVKTFQCSPDDVTQGLPIVYMRILISFWWPVPRLKSILSISVHYLVALTHSGWYSTSRNAFSEYRPENIGISTMVPRLFRSSFKPFVASPNRIR